MVAGAEEAGARGMSGGSGKHGGVERLRGGRGGEASAERRKPRVAQLVAAGGVREEQEQPICLF